MGKVWTKLINVHDHFMKQNNSNNTHNPKSDTGVSYIKPLKSCEK